MSSIVIEKGPGRGGALELRRNGEYLIGSGAICNLVLPSASVRPKHLLVRFSNGQCQVEQLSGTGGFFVNGERAIRKRLSGGDEIRVGECFLVYRQDRLGGVFGRLSWVNPLRGGHAAVWSKLLPVSFFAAGALILIALRGLSAGHLAIVAAVLLILFLIVQDFASSHHSRIMGTFSKHALGLLRQGVAAGGARCGVDELDEVLAVLERYVRTVNDEEGTVGARQASLGAGALTETLPQVVRLIEVPAVAVGSDNCILAANSEFAAMARLRGADIINGHLLDVAGASEAAGRAVDAMKAMADDPEAAAGGLFTREQVRGWGRVACVGVPLAGARIDIYAFFS